MKKILTLLLMILTISLTVIPVSFAADDNSLYRDNSSSMFAPGYLNAAKYQAEAIIHQQTPRKSLAENIIEFVMGKTEAKIEKTQAETAQKKPKLQQKQSSSNKAQTASAKVLVDSTQYNIVIGSGTNKVYDNSEKILLSETINGTRHVYAGFDSNAITQSAQAIQSAVDLASQYGGGIVIVKGDVTYTGNITIANGVQLYGGYGADGVRDIASTPTIISGAVSFSSSDSSELNGFTINGPSFADLVITSSSNIKIINNIFNGSPSYSYATYIGYSSVILENNIFNARNGVCVWDAPSLTSGNQASNITVTSNTFNSYVGLNLTGKAENPLIVSSSNNDFNGAYWLLGGNAELSSNNDYIVGVEFNNSTVNFNITNQATNPNTFSYGGYVTFNVPSANNTLGLVNTSTPALDEYNSFKPLSNENNYKTADPNEIGSIFRTLLSNKDGLKSFGVTAGPMDPTLTTRMMENNLRSDAIAIPINQNVKEQEIGIAQSLANILKNPTEDQKVMLDAIKALLADTSKLQDNEGKETNPDLRKAENDLLNAVANILLAQAVPGLLKSGDMSNIKAMFSEFDQARAKIMLAYTQAQSTRPYYENMIKDLARNMAMLQAKSLISPDMTKEELSKLPPSELDKILEKIRNMKDKTFEEEYILQQEAKYRKAYIDPNKKKLEDEMKSMLKGFTGRISDALKSSEKK